MIPITKRTTKKPKTSCYSFVNSVNLILFHILFLNGQEILLKSVEAIKIRNIQSSNSRGLKFSKKVARNSLKQGKFKNIMFESIHFKTTYVKKIEKKFSKICQSFRVD
jgi:hypothetical protein